MKRIQMVVTDGFTLNPGDNPWGDIEPLGTLAVYDRTAPPELVPRCREADILIVNKTPVRADALAALPQLRFIAVTATGFDCVDVAAAGRRGIPVSNVPIYGTDSVAQYVFSAILHVWHNISSHDAAVKAGEWGRQPDWSFWRTPLIELRGKTMGIVGFGRIGRRVGELAHAFGMSVRAHDAFTGADPGFTPFAWAAREARQRLMRTTAENVRAFLEGRPQHLVNGNWLGK
jgi:glycerate dehydrogenase